MNRDYAACRSWVSPAPLFCCRYTVAGVMEPTPGLEYFAGWAVAGMIAWVLLFRVVFRTVVRSLATHQQPWYRQRPYCDHERAEGAVSLSG